MIETLFPAIFWDHFFFGNTIGAYVNAFLVFVIFAFVFYVINCIFMHQLERLADRTQTRADDIFLKILSRIKPPFYLFIAFYIGFKTLVLHPLVDRTVFVVVVLWCTWQVMRTFDLFIDYISERASSKGSANASVQSAVSLLSGIAKAAIWVIAALMILSNFGVNVTSLIAGVGIGGIAIAFAVKGILEDLFSSFSIYFDKPFQVGDMIQVDDEKGIVQKIGVKTTRLKSMITGEEVIIANKDLTNKKINNFHRMTKRRVSFDLGVTYETPTKKIKKIPQIVEDIITSKEKTTFNRAHFRSFEDSALRFTILYHYDSRNYDAFLATHESILFEIREVFEKEKIDMAYPTQMIHIRK